MSNSENNPVSTFNPSFGIRCNFIKVVNIISWRGTWQNFMTKSSACKSIKQAGYSITIPLLPRDPSNSLSPDCN